MKESYAQYNVTAMRNSTWSLTLNRTIQWSLQMNRLKLKTTWKKTTDHLIRRIYGIHFHANKRTIQWSLQMNRLKLKTSGKKTDHLRGIYGRYLNSERFQHVTGWTWEHYDLEQLKIWPRIFSPETGCVALFLRGCANKGVNGWCPGWSSKFNT